jgi:hypothetical protein
MPIRITLKNCHQCKTQVVIRGGKLPSRCPNPECRSRRWNGVDKRKLKAN